VTTSYKVKIFKKTRCVFNLLYKVFKTCGKGGVRLAIVNDAVLLPS